MIKHFLLLLGLFFLFTTSKGQTISGKVMDEHNQPLSYANVTLKDMLTDSLVTGAGSDRSGRYELKITKNGQYRLNISSIGYYADERVVDITQTTVLPTIILKENATELSSVTVMAHYTNRKKDGRISSKISGNPISKGKQISQVLQYLPGVDVGNTDIRINGREGTIILLGERKISLQELNTLPTEMIDRVEIIPMLGSEYGVNTNGGAISVILKEESGLLGSFSPTLQFNKLGFVASTLSSSLMYRKGKFNFLNSIKAGAGKYTTIYERTDANATVSETFLSKLVNKDKGLLENLTLGYDFNAKSSLKLSGGFIINKINSTLNSENKTNPEQSLFQDRTPDTKTYSAGLNYKQILDKRKSTFNFNLDYIHQDFDNEITYNTGSSQRISNHTNYLFINPKVNIKLAAGQELKAGLLFNYLEDYNSSISPSNSKLARLVPVEYNIDGYDYGVWAEYDKYFGEQYYLSVGLRYQGDKMIYNNKLNPLANYHITYSGLYPTLKLQGMIDKDRMSGFSLSYRHYFSLPNYGYYSPLVVYQSENLYSKGDPYLSKESFDLAEISYMINRQYILTYQFNYGKNLIYVMTHQDNENPNIYYTIPENIGTRYRNRLIFSANLSPSIFWKSNNDLTCEYSNEDGGNISIKNTSVEFRSRNQFSVTKNIGINLNMNASSKQNRLNIVQMPVYSASVGGYISLMKNNLWINLQLNNVLYNRNKIEIHHKDFTAARIDLSPVTRFQLTASWTFSAGKKIKKVQDESIPLPNKEMPAY